MMNSIKITVNTFQRNGKPVERQGRKATGSKHENVG